MNTETTDYDLLLQQAKALLSTENDIIANAANLSSLLYFNLSEVNWIGFYFYHADKNELVLGPFHGQPACTRIPVGNGVCGTAFAQQKTQRVDDVHQFEGHITCDTNSQSEVVVPFQTDKVAGVLDIDSPTIKRFGEAEQSFFESTIRVFLASIG